MQDNNSIGVPLILKKLKKALTITTDIQLAKILKVKPNTISTWKKRNSLDYKAIISICELYEIDLNSLFLEKTAVQISNGQLSSNTPFISRDVQFQYCIGSDELMARLPKYNFPFENSEETRAFQVPGNNMSPIIEENSVVICKSCAIEVIPENSLVVVVSKAKGFFINRITKANKKDTFVLLSANSFFAPVAMHSSEIDEIWLINGIISYAVNQHNKTQLNTESVKMETAVRKNAS